jgi:hypothetical protein
MFLKDERSTISVGRIFIKTVIILLIIDILYVCVNQTSVGHISLYNSLLPGRERLPFGDNPSRSYNLTINNIEAMFSSLSLAGEEKHADEYRIFIVGDSSVWGSLQNNSDMLTGQLNHLNIKRLDGKNIIFYNLGYPTLAILKDLMILDRALSYHPDLIIWLVTLESFPDENQANSELLKNNAALVNHILIRYGLEEPYHFIEPGFIDRTLFSQRRNLADIARLQAYGIMWAATGIDQDLNTPFIPARRDFEEDDSFHEKGNRNLESELSMEVLQRAIEKMPVPVLLINEPILISHGKNSDIRYNYYYPRWAYDQYRIMINKAADELRVPFYDFYDLVPENMFTNSAIHLNRDGESILAQQIAAILKNEF